MTRCSDNAQARFVTAVENTKHHYGLWRGQLVHPQFGVVTDAGAPIGVGMRDVVESGDSITDAKGLGIRLFWRAPKGVIPHFFINDAQYFDVMRSAYPKFHNAAVRVLAAHIRSEGYAGLRQLVFCKAFPKKPFPFGGVYTERNIGVNGVVYRPDIVVEHADPDYPRVELEVVNKHPPEARRLRAARAEGALVLCMNIHDVVQHHILDGRSRDFVPSDDNLLEQLKRLRFADVVRGDSAGHHSFRARWMDQEQVPYLEGLRSDVERLSARVVAASVACAKLTGLEGLDSVWDCRLPLSGHTLDSVEDWALGRVGMCFGPDDRVEVPEMAREVDKVLKNWAGASVVPPRVGWALSRLRSARGELNVAIEDLLDAAGGLWDRAIQARSEEIRAELPRKQEEAVRIFRLLLRSVEKDFVALRAELASGTVPPRIHRRGALAGTVARTQSRDVLRLLSKADSIRSRLRDAYRFAYLDVHGEPLRDLLQLPEDTKLPNALRREVDALAETLNSPELPTEQAISRLVNLITETNEAR